jgi:hypothetical protein
MSPCLRDQQQQQGGKLEIGYGSKQETKKVSKVAVMHSQVALTRIGALLLVTFVLGLS